MLSLISEGIVQGGDDERSKSATYVSDDEFVMDFGMIAIPSTQIATDIEFPGRSFGLLFQGTPVPHPPRRFTRTATRSHQIQPPFDQFVHDLCRFHLFPERKGGEKERKKERKKEEKTKP
jgi:hypothetical protein